MVATILDFDSEYSVRKWSTSAVFPISFAPAARLPMLVCDPAPSLSSFVGSNLCWGSRFLWHLKNVWVRSKRWQSIFHILTRGAVHAKQELANLTGHRVAVATVAVNPSGRVQAVTIAAGLLSYRLSEAVRSDERATAFARCVAYVVTWAGRCPR